VRVDRAAARGGQQEQEGGRAHVKPVYRLLSHYVHETATLPPFCMADNPNLAKSCSLAILTIFYSWQTREEIAIFSQHAAASFRFADRSAAELRGAWNWDSVLLYYSLVHNLGSAIRSHTPFSRSAGGAIDPGTEARRHSSSSRQPPPIPLGRTMPIDLGGEA
jgi:hypothetical protein